MKRLALLIALLSPSLAQAQNAAPTGFALQPNVLQPLGATDFALVSQLVNGRQVTGKTTLGALWAGYPLTSGGIATALGYTPQPALGYTPANKAGDTFTGAVGITTSGVTLPLTITSALSGTASLAYWNSINVATDTVTPCAFCVDLNVTHHYQSLTRGARNAIFGWMIQDNAATTGSSATVAVGLTGIGQSNAGDGGTNLTNAGVKGTYFGANVMGRNAGTNVQEVVGIESDLMTTAASSARYAFAYTAANYAAVQGSALDAAFGVYAGGSINASGGSGPWGPGLGFHCGICFAELSNNGLVPLDSGATVLGTHLESLGTIPAAHGIDLSGFTFSADAFKSNLFAVSQNGDVFAQNYWANGRSVLSDTHVNLATGGAFQINGTSVLSAVGGAPTLGTLPVTVGSSGAASANDTLIAAALAAMNTAGGGTIRLPCGDVYTSATIDNKYPRVLVEGCGDDYQHNAGSNPTYGTRIVPTFAGTALKHRTPYSATTTKFFGGGFRHLTVIGNSIATRLLEVDSIAGGTYDLYLEDSVGAEAAYFKSGVTGTDLAEDAGIQLARINLRIRQLDSVAAANADGVVFDGSINANFSYNPWIVLDVTHKNGTAAKFKNADNNTITFRSFRAPGGTGKAIRMYGAQASGVVGGTLNRFMRLQAAVADGSTTDLIYSEGTDTGGVSAGVQNDIQALDTGNGTPDPTHGTGSLWRWTNNLTLATHGSGSFDLNTGSSYQINGTQLLTMSGTIGVFGNPTANESSSSSTCCNHNLINTTDTAILTNSGAFLNNFNVQSTMNSTSIQGGRQNFYSLLTQTAITSGSNANRNYAAGAFNVTSSSGDGGSGLSAVLSKGAYFGINPVAVLQSGATNVYDLSGGEVNIAAQTGSSTFYKAGLRIASLGSDAVPGTGTDAMLSLTAQAGAVGWGNGIAWTNESGQYPMISTATLMLSSGGTVGNGVDFSGTTITGSAFKSTGFSVSGSGNTAVNSMKLNKIAVASLPTCNAGAEGTLYAVTDANSTTFNAAVAAGGANHVMAFCNGTGWTVH